jgi:putative DNA primase/helicase
MYWSGVKIMNLEEAYKRADKFFKRGISQAERTELLTFLPLDGDMEPLLSYNEKLGEPKKQRASSQIHGESGFHLTDTGNGKRLIRHYGDSIRYSYERDKWLIWTGKQWEWDNGAIISQYAKETAISIYAEASKEPDDTRRAEIAAHAKASESQMRIKAMIASAQSEPGIVVKIDQLDNNDWLLNVNNGTIDLHTGELRSYNRADMITRLIPTDYDSGARSDVWESFLLKIFHDSQEMVDYIQRCFGYAITGDTSQDYFWFFYGTGWNGKSTLLHAITTVLTEDYAAECEPNVFMIDEHRSGINEGIANLYKIRAVSCTELKDGDKLDVALVKRMTGGEKLTHERKYEHAFDYKPNYKLFMAGNHEPRITDTTNSIWFRLHKVSFSYTIPEGERQQDFRERLPKENAAAILTWLVKGCLMFQEHGLTRPDEVAKTTAEYRNNQDVLKEFIDEMCIVHPSASITQKELFNTYKTWCEENGTFPLGKLSFNSRLEERGYTKYRGNLNKLTWRGIRLRTLEDGDVTSVTSVTGFTGNSLHEADIAKVSEKEVTDITKVTENTELPPPIPDSPNGPCSYCGKDAGYSLDFSVSPHIWRCKNCGK